MMFIIILICNVVALPSDISLYMQANKSKYTVIDNGDLMPTFNTELSNSI